MNVFLWSGECVKELGGLHMEVKPFRSFELVRLPSRPARMDFTKQTAMIKTTRF